jgi:hypothetical protein
VYVEWLELGLVRLPRYVGGGGFSSARLVFPVVPREMAGPRLALDAATDWRGEAIPPDPPIVPEMHRDAAVASLLVTLVALYCPV